MNNFENNLLYSRKNISKDVHTHIVENFLPNNCEIRGCLEPWTFTLKSFDNKNYSCKKYCLNHSDKWINTLFVNPYYIIFNNKKYTDTLLNYNLTFNNNNIFIQIQIIINSNNILEKITFNNFNDNVYIENNNKLDIIKFIKNNINFLQDFSKSLTVRELGDLRGLSYDIYNSNTNKITQFTNIIK